MAFTSKNPNFTGLTVTNPIVGSVTGSSGSSSGNAATATALQTARNINGVPFDGTDDITVPAAASTLTGSTLNSTILNSSLTSVGTLATLTVTATIIGSITGASGSTTGNAATATALQNARTINGVSFDGSANIVITANAGTLTGATLNSSVVNSSLTSVGTLTNLTVTNPISGSITGSSGSTTGNAATATALQSPRNINGVAFDGTMGITITANAGTLTGTTLNSTVINSSLTSVGILSALTVTAPISGSITGSSGSTTGNAATATALQTARNINGVAFDGSAPITITSAAGTLTGNTLNSSVLTSSLTSVGTLTALTVSATIIGSINGNAATVTTNANLTGPITSMGNATAIANSINLPGSPTTTTQSPFDNSNNIATTAYTDAAVAAASVTPFTQANLATTAALPSNVYNNGTSGVGATLTGLSIGTLTIDGATASGDVVIKNEGTPANNGIYTTTQNGSGVVYILTRRSDADQSNQFIAGKSVFIQNGTANNSTTWTLNSTSNPTIGTSSINFTQTGGKQTLTAGNGITIISNQIAIDTTITADLTSVQTLTNKILSGNTSTNFVNGSGILNINSTGNLTLPNTGTSDTLVTNAFAATLTNKTYDTAGSGNVFKVAGITVSGLQGSGGSLVMATAPTFVTPVLGTPTSGTLTNCSGLPISSGVSGLAVGIATFLGTPTSANLASAITTSTGSGLLVFGTSPNLVTPVLGTPASGTLTNCAGLPISSGVSGLATNIANFLATPTSANLLSAMTVKTGTGSLVFATAPTFITPVLGTPTTGTLTNCTGLPVGSGISGLGAGIATFLATPSSANLVAAVTGSTGSGALVFGTNPTFSTPILGTPASGTLTNCTGLPISAGVSGLGSGIAAFLATPTSANLAAAVVTTSTGSGALTFANTPSLITPSLGAATAISIAATSILKTTQVVAGSANVDGVVLTNTTAATSSVQQNSPALRLTGQGWKTNATAASQEVDFSIYNSIGSGTAKPLGILEFSYQINGGGYSIPFAIRTDNLVITSQNTLDDGSGNMGVNGTLNVVSTFSSGAISSTGTIKTTQMVTSTVAADGFIALNSTAATVSQNEFSPAMRWSGQGWKTNSTASSQQVDVAAYLETFTGTTSPTGVLYFSGQVNSGGYIALLTLNTNGTISTSLNTLDDGSGNMTNAGLTTSRNFLSNRTVNTTSNDGMAIVNSTAATVSQNQWSGRLRLTGQAWASTPAASQEVDFIIETQADTGTTNPLGYFVLSSQVNGGGYNQAFVVDTGGNAIVKAMLQVAGSIYNIVDNTFIACDDSSNRMGFCKKAGNFPQITSVSGTDIIFSNLNESTLSTANIIAGTLTNSLVIKNGGELDIYGSIIPQTNASFNLGGASNTFAGLFLQTTNGTPTALDYYEEFTQSMTFAGPWASNQTVTIRLTRIGRNVLLTIPAIQVAGNSTSSTITSTTALPTRFIPSNICDWGIKVINSGADTAGMVAINQGTSGKITIYVSPSAAFTSTSSTAGFYTISVPYDTAN